MSKFEKPRQKSAIKAFVLSDFEMKREMKIIINLVRRANESFLSTRGVFISVFGCIYFTSMISFNL